MIITNPFKDDKPFYMDAQTFYELFCNTMTFEEAETAWETYATYDSRNVLRDCMGEAAHINPDKKHKPMLFIGGTEDKIIPVSLVHKNAESYTDKTSIADFKEFTGRSHFICCQPGWREVAEYVANWIKQYEKPKYRTSKSLKH